MSEIVVLKSTFVSRLSALLPTRCQNRYARCGRPPASLEPNTTSARPRRVGANRAGNSAGAASPPPGRALDPRDVAVHLLDRRTDRGSLAAVLLPHDDDVGLGLPRFQNPWRVVG